MGKEEKEQRQQSTMHPLSDFPCCKLGAALAFLKLVNCGRRRRRRHSTAEEEPKTAVHHPQTELSHFPGSQ